MEHATDLGPVHVSSLDEDLGKSHRQRAASLLFIRGQALSRDQVAQAQGDLSETMVEVSEDDVGVLRTVWHFVFPSASWIRVDPTCNEHRLATYAKQWSCRWSDNTSHPTHARGTSLSLTVTFASLVPSEAITEEHHPLSPEKKPSWATVSRTPPNCPSMQRIPIPSSTT